MLGKVSEFATKTFLLWMFIAAIRNCDVRHGNDN